MKRSQTATDGADTTLIFILGIAVGAAAPLLFLAVA